MTSDKRQDIIDVIQQIYWLQVLKMDESKPKLNIYGVSSKNLEDYVTTAKDIIRGVNRIPGTFFLLNNQSSKKEQQNEMEDYDMLFDDFVFIDREEAMNKLEANMQISEEKIQKEEKLMSQKSQLLQGKENTTLNDFKIKRVLDKGSFGKVFLVVNTKDGTEYAMKRINKDVLIEKG